MSAAKPLLLIVDDNEENRDLLSRRLARLGYRVLVAADGREALRITEGPMAVDLVILDIMMPGMSGIDVLRSLRRRLSEVELPVIMASAKSDSEDVVEALELGANDYVTKPLDMPVVVARIEAQLRRLRGAETVRARPRGVGPGTLLAHRYRVQAAIGSGAFGTVYRARHLDLDKDIALKVLHHGVMGEPAALARFRREGISACRVRHPNAVSVMDFGVTEDGTAFLVMELLAGRSLAETLDVDGPLDARRCVTILTPVCHALQAAHDAGVIHRDIKPSNIFLHSATGEGEVVKVLDFGIAKVTGDATWGQTVTGVGTLVGTPAYMAPERLQAKPYDGKSDVFSLGVTLYQMLTGDLPFAGRDADPLALALVQLSESPPLPSAVNARVPREVETLVVAAMHKRPEARPSAGELGRALSALA